MSYLLCEQCNTVREVSETTWRNKKTEFKEHEGQLYKVGTCHACANKGEEVPDHKCNLCGEPINYKYLYLAKNWTPYTMCDSCHKSKRRTHIRFCPVCKKVEEVDNIAKTKRSVPCKDCADKIREEKKKAHRERHNQRRREARASEPKKRGRKKSTNAFTRVCEDCGKEEILKREPISAICQPCARKRKRPLKKAKPKKYKQISSKPDKKPKRVERTSKDISPLEEFDQELKNKASNKGIQSMIRPHTEKENQMIEEWLKTNKVYKHPEPKDSAIGSKMFRPDY